MYKLALIIFSILLTGCISKYKSLPPNEGVALTIQNKGTAALTNILVDKNCTKHPNGAWLGSIGEMKISSMSEYQKTVYVAPGQNMTLYMEWWDMGPVSGHCVQRATFAPLKGVEYFAVYSWESIQCSLTVSQRLTGTDEFTPVALNDVEYDSKHCEH